MCARDALPMGQACVLTLLVFARRPIQCTLRIRSACSPPSRSLADVDIAVALHDGILWTRHRGRDLDPVPAAPALGAPRGTGGALVPTAAQRLRGGVCLCVT